MTRVSFGAVPLGVIEGWRPLTSRVTNRAGTNQCPQAGGPWTQIRRQPAEIPKSRGRGFWNLFRARGTAAPIRRCARLRRSTGGSAAGVSVRKLPVSMILC